MTRLRSMLPLMLVVLSLFGGIGHAASYSTTFTGTENPLSEGGAFDVPGSPRHDPMQKIGGVAQADALDNSVTSVARLVSPGIGSNQFSQATMTANTGAGEINLYTRLQSSSNASGYYLTAHTTQVLIWRVTDTGTALNFTNLGTFAVAAVSDVLRLESIGTVHTYWKNGVVQGSVTDATYAGGQPGFGAWVPTTGTLTGHTLDTWSGGDTGSSYSTTFTGTENPLSESGAFGPSGSPRYAPMQKVGGVAESSVISDTVAGLSMLLSPLVGADQFSQATLTANTTPGESDLFTRVQSSGNASSYMLAMDTTGTFLYRVDDTGSILNYTVLASFPIAAVNDVLRLESIGDMHLYSKNGVIQGSVRDATYTGGQPGLGAWIPVGSALTSHTLDTWSGGATIAIGPTCALTWINPTQNTDNSPLTTLAKYRVYMRRTGQIYTTVSLEISGNPPTNATTCAALGITTTGAVFWKVTAINSNGYESVDSFEEAFLYTPTATLPSFSFTASSPVTAGLRSTLLWSTPSDATSCTPTMASGPTDTVWTSLSSAALLAGGTVQSGVLSSSLTYRMTCTGPGGAAPPIDAAVVVTPDTTAPGVPTGFGGIANDPTQITYTWGAPTDNVAVTGYKLYWCAGPACTPASPITIANVLTFAHTGLTGSTIYRTQLSATDAAGNEGTKTSVVQVSTPAAADTTRPSDVTGCGVVVVSGVELDVSCSAASDNVAVVSYRLYRCTPAVCVTTLYQTIGSPAYADMGLTPGVSYTYQMTAMDAAGNESLNKSTAVTATTSLTVGICQ